MTRARPPRALAALLVLAALLAPGCLGSGANAPVFTLANATPSPVSGKVELMKPEGGVEAEASFSVPGEKSHDLGALTRRLGDYEVVLTLDDGRTLRQNVTLDKETRGVGLVVTQNELLVRRSRA